MQKRSRKRNSKKDIDGPTSAANGGHIIYIYIYISWMKAERERKRAPNPQKTHRQGERERTY